MLAKLGDDELPVMRANTDRDDLYSKYENAAEKLRDVPQAIKRYQQVFCETTQSLVESHGELLVDCL